jgi:hypothetical protein
MHLNTELNIRRNSTLCGQSTSISKGVRRTKTMGNRRIRLCKASRRKFTPKHQQGPEREEVRIDDDTEVVREDPRLAYEAATALDKQPPLFRPATDLIREPGGAE